MYSFSIDYQELFYGLYLGLFLLLLRFKTPNFIAIFTGFSRIKFIWKNHVKT